MSSKLPRLVALIGRKGSGKDTAADVLLQEGYVNVKFAGALKAMIDALLTYQGVDAATVQRMIEGDLKEEPSEYLAGMTPRYAMQTLGTEWGRDLIGKGFWAGTTMARVRKYMAANKRVILTDTRFPNEVEVVEEEGGVAIGVSADWIVPTEGEHESEALIDKLIAALPASRKIVNWRGIGDEIPKVIQEFRFRFLHLLHAL